MKQLSFLIIILLSISLTGEDKVSFSVDKIKVSKFESLKNYNSRYGVRTYKDAHKIFLKVDYLITPKFDENEKTLRYEHSKVKLLDSNQKEYRNFWHKFSSSFTFTPSKSTKYFRHYNFEELQSCTAIFIVPLNSTNLKIDIYGEQFEILIPEKFSEQNHQYKEISFNIVKTEIVDKVVEKHGFYDQKFDLEVSIPNTKILKITIEVIPGFVPQKFHVGDFSLYSDRFGLIDTESNNLIDPIGVYNDKNGFRSHYYFHSGYDQKSAKWDKRSHTLVFVVGDKSDKFYLTLDSLKYNKLDLSKR